MQLPHFYISIIGKRILNLHETNRNEVIYKHSFDGAELTLLILNFYLINKIWTEVRSFMFLLQRKLYEKNGFFYCLVYYIFRILNRKLKKIKIKNNLTWLVGWFNCLASTRAGQRAIANGLRLTSKEGSVTWRQNFNPLRRRWSNDLGVKSRNWC